MKDQLVTHKDKIYDGTNKCLSITVHETANPDPGADAQAHADLQSGDGARNASWHAQVDDREAIRSYPDTAQCWHAGTDEGNRHSLAVEICVNEGGDYDAAFKRAAGVVRDWRIKHKLSRADVKQHFEWTGKNCPSEMRLANRWQEFLDLTEPNQTVGVVKPVVGMISPVQGRVSSEWSKSRLNPATGRRTSHAGIDIAAPVGTDVVAAFGGTVEEVRTNSYPGDPRLWEGLKSGNFVRIRNTDNARQWYGHLSKVNVKKGQKVVAGQKIGEVGATGKVTGPHVHLETWSNKYVSSHFNPRILFERYGITPGSAPSVNVQPVGNVTPAKPKPKPKPKPSAGSNDKRDYIAIAKALNKMGLNAGYPDGVNGPMLKGATKAFQRAHGLVADGHWGAVTQAKFDEVKAVQKALRSEGYSKQGVDGYYGDQTTANVRDYQRRVGLHPDGIAGPITRKKLGVK